jgi:hypothetical protein
MLMSCQGTSWTAWRFFPNTNVRYCACLCSKFSYLFLLSREPVYQNFFIIQYIVLPCSSAGTEHIWWNFQLHFFCDTYLT